jgi:hypothetical protein
MIHAFVDTLSCLVHTLHFKMIETSKLFISLNLIVYVGIPRKQYRNTGSSLYLKLM